MDVTLNTLTGLNSSITQAGAVTNATGTSEETTTNEESLSFDQLKLSDAGKMLSTAARMAGDGNDKAQDFLSALENGLETGNLNMETLLKNAPDELLSAMENEGIDVGQALQTLSIVAETISLQPITSETGSLLMEEADEDEELTLAEQAEEAATQTEEEEETDETSAAPAGGPGGAGGAAGAASSEDTDTIEEQIESIEDQIEQLEQEIEALMGKEQTEETRTDLSSKQAELATLQAELATLESEQSDSESE